MGKKILIIFYFAVLFIPQFVEVAAGKGNIRIGKLKVIPSITIQSVHDDNIYLGNGTNNTTELKQSDWIHNIKPSLNVIYDFNVRGSVQMGYQGNYAYYDKNDRNNWNTHKGLLNIDYKAPSGFILGIDNTYINAEDPYGSESQYKLGIPQTERWSNNLKTKIGYDFGNRLIGMGYFNYFKQDYEKLEDYTQDYYSREYGTGIRFRLLPKTWTFLRYHYGERDYFTHPVGTGVTENNDSDFNWHRVNAGLSWGASAKGRGEINFGYAREDYDNLFDVNGNIYDSRSSWIAATSFYLKGSPFSLRLTRSMREVASNTNEYFMDTGIGLGLQQKILPKITLSAGGIYTMSDYNLPMNQPREDNNLKANIGVSYRIQDWLSTGVRYNYSEKDSNYNANDYTDHQVMIYLKGGY